jgi:hypothetical protein
MPRLRLLPSRAAAWLSARCARRYEVRLDRADDGSWEARRGRRRERFTLVEGGASTDPALRGQVGELLATLHDGNHTARVLAAVFGGDAASGGVRLRILLAGTVVAGACVLLDRRSHGEPPLLDAIVVAPAFRGTGAADVLCEELRALLDGAPVEARVVRSGPFAARGPFLGGVDELKARLGIRSRVVAGRSGGSAMI